MPIAADADHEHEPKGETTIRDRDQPAFGRAVILIVIEIDTFVIATNHRSWPDSNLSLVNGYEYQPAEAGRVECRVQLRGGPVLQNPRTTCARQVSRRRGVWQTA